MKNQNRINRLSEILTKLSKGQDVEIGKVDGYDNSSDETTINHTVARLNILSYNSHGDSDMSYSIGMGYGEESSYDITNYDVEEKITYVAVKFLIGAELLGDWAPTVGFSTEKTDGKEKLANNTYSKTEEKVIIGFNKRF